MYLFLIKMAFQLIFGLGVFSLVSYQDEENIPKFLKELLIVVLIIIVALQQDQIHIIKDELAKVSALCENNTEELKNVISKMKTTLQN